MTPVLRMQRRSTEQKGMPYTGANADDIVAWVRAEGGEAYIAEGHLYLVTDRPPDSCPDPGDTIMKGLAGEFYPLAPVSRDAGWDVLGEWT